MVIDTTNINRQLDITTKLLKSLSSKLSKTEFLQFILNTVQEFSNCEAIGIRVINNKGFMPYEVYTGFSREFWEAENLLCIQDNYCVCTRIVNQNIEPQDMPLISKGGSFCTKNLKGFFDGLSSVERSRFRGRCVDFGYKSLGVIPINYQNEIVGVIHLADKRPNMLSEGALEFIEGIAPFVGELVHHFCLEDEIKEAKDNKSVINALFDDARAIAYVTDINTYEVLYVTKMLQEKLGSETIGEKCYQQFYGRKYPCDFCKVPELKSSFDKSLHWERTEEGKTYSIIDKIIPWSDEREAHFVLSIDVTSQKSYEKKLEYISIHDDITGLYNRRYFNQEMDSFDANGEQVGLVLFDIDGLKLVNESMGDHEGDRLLANFAKILKDSFNSKCTISRIGSDEFAVIVPSQEIPTLEAKRRKVKLGVFKVFLESVLLNFSSGFAVRSEPNRSMAELYAEAEQNMVSEKLLHDQSVRSSTIKVLTEALRARDFITEGHANRLQRHVVKMAEFFGAKEPDIAKLRLFAEFHDLGKVGIPDSILHKKGPLTSEERQEMNNHSKIGSRIAQSSPDLLPISQWILCHHENWDGSGYPLGLKGNDIPMECRMLSIADAYDAMTNDRPYRKAMRHVDAVAEIKRCAGKQFDPSLVNVFTNFVLDLEYSV